MVRTDAEAEAPLLWPPDAKRWHWERLGCWERLKAGGEGDNRGWDGWTASLTQRTWIWANSRRKWGTGKPGAAAHGVVKSRAWLSDQPTKGLSCGTWDFHSSSQRMRSLTLVCGLYLPDKGSNPGFLSQELRGLLTAPPGKSQNTC